MDDANGEKNWAECPTWDATNFQDGGQSCTDGRWWLRRHVDRSTYAVQPGRLLCPKNCPQPMSLSAATVLDSLCSAVTSIAVATRRAITSVINSLISLASIILTRVGRIVRLLTQGYATEASLRRYAVHTCWPVFLLTVPTSDMSESNTGPNFTQIL